MQLAIGMKHMAYCPGCSASIKSNASKCPKCGADFSVVDAWKPLKAAPSSEPKGGSRHFWLLFLLVDAVFATIATAVVHTYDCRVGTHEQCLMSSGMIVGYWLVFLIFPGSLVAAAATFVRNAMAESKNRREPD